MLSCDAAYLSLASITPCTVVIRKHSPLTVAFCLSELYIAYYEGDMREQRTLMTHDGRTLRELKRKEILDQLCISFAGFVAYGTPDTGTDTLGLQYGNVPGAVACSLY